jgi:proline iminopeptidase
MRYYNITTLLFAALNLTCVDRKIPVEGFINVKGGKIWYKVVGSEMKKTPVLLLHGGPGFPSNYLQPLAALSSDRPVIFYDQLGCGRSDKPNDTTLWNLERFVEELSSLRLQLGLDTIHLFAHSWGTMLAAEYMSTSPKGIKTVIFSGPIFSTKQHLENVNLVKMRLPTYIRDTLLFHEKNGTTQSEGYMNAYDEYSKIHFCRIFPYPKEIQESMQLFGVQTFETMWGQYEFYCPGNLKGFERTRLLKNIEMPTLFTCGRYDVITPETTGGYAKQVKGAEFVVFEKSAHMPMNEEPDSYAKVIRTFLNKNE